MAASKKMKDIIVNEIRYSIEKMDEIISARSREYSTVLQWSLESLRNQAKAVYRFIDHFKSLMDFQHPFIVPVF